MLNTFLLIALIVCGSLIRITWDEGKIGLMIAIIFLTIIIFATKTAIDIGRI